MNAIDLFCGCGGLSEGFEDAGFKIIVGNDIDQDMISSFKINHPNSKAIVGDICKLSSDALLDGTGVKKEKIDIIIGGPPCQGFSTVGDRRKDDSRNKLFYEFVRIVKEINPKIFVMENVPGILTMQGGKVKETIIEEFKKAGYHLDYTTLFAENYGIPQKRRRVFFVGNKFKNKKFDFPEPTHGEKNDIQSTLNLNKLNQFLTVWDAIGDLPQISAGQSKRDYVNDPETDFQKFLRNGEKELLEHRAPVHSEIVIERLKNIKEGENHSNLPKELKLGSGYPNIYGRLIANKPSDTITGNCGCISAPGRFVHPFGNRAITVREAARLQSFRDSKKFVGSQNSKYKQVGNSVPPLLAKALAMQIRKFFKSNLNSE